MAIRFVEKVGRHGTLASSLDDATAVIEGTHVAPPARTGTIAAQLQSATAQFTGTFVPSASRTGVINSVLVGASANLTGSFSAGNQPPVWQATPAPPTFVIGNPSTYTLPPVTDPEGQSVFLSVSPAGTPLPSGVTLDAANHRLVWSGSGTAGTTSGHRIRASDSTAEADWIARSTGPGVVLADLFTSQLVNQGKFANGNNPVLLANVTFNPTGGVLGTGCLRITHPPNVGADPGAWRRAWPNFWGSGLNTQRWFLCFRILIGPGMLSSAYTSVGGDGPKFAIISHYNYSNTAFELVPWNPFHNGILQVYRSGGVPITPNPSPSFQLVENEWITIKFDVRAAAYGSASPNNHFRVYAARRGATQWTQLYNLSGTSMGAFFGNEGGGVSFDGMWFTQYNTGRPPGGPTTYVEWDQPILSTQDIPLPQD